MNPFWHCWWLESNLVQFVEKPWWGKIISVILCGETFLFFFFLCFLVKFLSCKYYDVFFIIIIIPLFFSDWLTTLWISAHPPSPLPSPTPLPIISKAPQTSQMSYFHASFSGRRWRKIDIFIRFCTWLKRSNCAKSLSTQNYHTNVVLNVLWVVEQRKDI